MDSMFRNFPLRGKSKMAGEESAKGGGASGREDQNNKSETVDSNTAHPNQFSLDSQRRNADRALGSSVEISDQSSSDSQLRKADRALGSSVEISNQSSSDSQRRNADRALGSGVEISNHSSSDARRRGNGRSAENVSSSIGTGSAYKASERSSTTLKRRTSSSRSTNDPGHQSTFRRIFAGIGRFFSDFGRVLKGIVRKKDVLKDMAKNNNRFVVMDSQTYREKLSFQLSGINLFVIIGMSMIVLVVITTIIIAFTPLRELIPGYTNTRMMEQAYRNSVQADSLAMVVNAQEQMLADIKDLLLGNDPAVRRAAMQQRPTADTIGSASRAYTHSVADSLLRSEVESADRYSFASAGGGDSRETSASTGTAVSMQLFFTPLKGKVISPFDPKIKHFGVDIAGVSNEVVKAAMSGTVIFSNFTVETGYVVAIQHAGDYISLYKHNSSLLKREGDVVRAGEPIAFMGNSGEQTTGPHLHFELWLGGKPVNPLQYISF